MSNQPPRSPWQRAVAVLEEAEVVGAVQALFTLKDMGLLDVPGPEEDAALHHFLEVKTRALLAEVMPVLERKLREALGLPPAPSTDKSAPEGQETAARP